MREFLINRRGFVLAGLTTAAAGSLLTSRVGGKGRRSRPGAALPLGTPDATPDDVTASWHTDPVARAGDNRILFGYSKSGGIFGIMERDANTGAVIDARIVLDDPERYVGINDHFMVVPTIVTNGPHAGQLWVFTVPHGANVQSTGDREFHFFTSPTQRIADLAPATGGRDPGRPNVLMCGSTFNYANVQERSDGLLTALVMNDAAPQSAPLLWTPTPGQTPVLGRPLYSIAGHPAGDTVQFYVNSVADPEQADTAFVIAFAHPSALGSPIKLARHNLATGRVVIAGKALPGDIYASTGEPVCTWAQLATIYTPPAGEFVRVHDVCGFGPYQARAVAVTHGTGTGDENSPSHAILWCPPGADQENAANWTLVPVGPQFRAASWDNAGRPFGRRYNSDIRFLPARDGHALRILLIVRDPATALYRCETWGIARNRSGAPALSLLEACPWAASPRPMRAFVNPGAATDNVQAVVYGYESYNGFRDFNPAPPQIITYAARQAVAVPASGNA